LLEIPKIRSLITALPMEKNAAIMLGIGLNYVNIANNQYIIL